MKEQEQFDRFHPIRFLLYRLAAKLASHNLWRYNSKDIERRAGYTLRELIPKIDRLQKIARRKFQSFLCRVEGVSLDDVGEKEFVLIRSYGLPGSTVDISEPILAGAIIKVRNFDVYSYGDEREWLINDETTSGPDYYYVTGKVDRRGNPIVFSLRYIDGESPSIISDWVALSKAVLERQILTAKRTSPQIRFKNVWPGRRTEIEVYIQGDAEREKEEGKERRRKVAPSRLRPAPVPVPI